MGVGKKSSSTTSSGGGGGVTRSRSMFRMKKPASPLRKNRKQTSAADEPSSTMKVAIVSRNRATETPATAAPTPGVESYVSDMVSSALDYASAPLEACGLLEKPEESAASQLSKVRSGQRVQGQRFAKAPIWGIAPVLSDDEDTVGGRDSDVGEYDDVELVLQQQTPERDQDDGQAGTNDGNGNGGRVGAIWKEAVDQKSGRTYYYHTITKEVSWVKPAGFDEQQEALRKEKGLPSANLAGAMEAEAQRQQQMEQDEVVHAARKNLLKSKEESRTRQAAAAAAASAAAAGASRPNNISSAASTAHTEDFVDASVASALETWRSATDPATGRTYYYNRVTKETKWDPPPELVDAYRSVVAKKAALQNSKGVDVGTGAGTAAGGAAVFGAAAVAAANANDTHTPKSSSNDNKSALSKGGKSIRKMLGMSKKGHKNKEGATIAADQAVLNGMAAANEELPDDERTDLGLTPTRTFSNVEVVPNAEGDMLSIERSGSNVSHSKKNLGMMAAVHALRTRTTSRLKSSAAAGGGGKSKKKKKKERVHGWRSVVDENSGKTYYYHTLTKETRWDQPEEYNEAFDARRSKSKKSRPKKDPAGASAKKPKRAIWKEAVDQKSGKTYFYHTITKEVTWVKPAGFDQQQEALKKEKEERQRKRAEAKERKRVALARSGGNPDLLPFNLELQKALASALPDQQKQHDELLEKYSGKEDDLLTALTELQEDTPFDEVIEYDAVLAKMDQIEARKSGSVLALAGAAVSAAAATAAAAVSTQPPSRADAPSIGRTYSTYTSGTGMRSELTERVNNVTKSISPGVAPIAEDGEDDDETSISSKAEENGAPRAEGGADADLQQTSEAVRTRSQRSNRSGMAARPTKEESYAEDNEHADQYSVSDTVSALSTDIEYAGIRARQERRQKKALGAAMEEKDWNKAATVAQELSMSRERSEDSNKKSSARYRASPARPARKASSSSDKEFNQSELDQYIAKNDWNSVAQYIAVMRSASQDDRDSKRQPRSRSDARSHASASYYSESSGRPRKQVGARSQLQFSHSYDESEYSDEWETDSQATEGSDWESYTSGPQGPPSYYSNRDTRERRRNDNAPADVPQRKMQV